MKMRFDAVWPFAALAFGSGCSFLGIRTEEQPRYEVLAREGRYEVRRYAPYLTATVVTRGSFRETQGQSFRVLAGYIFGKNQASARIPMTAPVAMEPRSEKIAMTAPVQMQEAGAGAWAMTFALPSRYTLETAPKPLDPRIVLREVPAGTVAAARYTWGFSEDRARRHEAGLRAWLAAQGAYEPDGEARISGYDPPWTLPFLRRNEVMIPVRSKEKR